MNYATLDNAREINKYVKKRWITPHRVDLPGDCLVTTVQGRVSLTLGHVSLSHGHVSLTLGHVSLFHGHVSLTLGHVPFIQRRVSLSRGHVSLTLGHVPFIQRRVSPGHNRLVTAHYRVTILFHVA